MSVWGGCSSADVGWPWTQMSLVLMDSWSGVLSPWPADGAVLSPEGVPVTAPLVLIFGCSDLTRGADSPSKEMSRTALSLVLIWSGSDPVCGAGETSGRGSLTADSLVLICVRFISSPGDSPVLLFSDGPVPTPPSLAETASRVLIRGRSRGDGSWSEGLSTGTSGGGGPAGGSWGADVSPVRGPAARSCPLADLFFFSRDSTPRRA